MSTTFFKKKREIFSSLATSYSHRDKVPTTIGAKELNFRVRYGNGCDLFAIITRLIECLFTQNWINGPLKAIQNFG